jgi:hypothetical protein
MKRSFSSHLVDWIILEPLLFAGLMALLVVKGPAASVDLAVFAVVGTVGTLINLLGLWLFVYIALARMAMPVLSKVLWAIALLVLAPIAIPAFHWRHLRRDFQVGTQLGTDDPDGVGCGVGDVEVAACVKGDAVRTLELG